MEAETSLGMRLNELTRLKLVDARCDERNQEVHPGRGPTPARSGTVGLLAIRWAAPHVREYVSQRFERVEDEAYALRHTLLCRLSLVAWT